MPRHFYTFCNEKLVNKYVFKLLKDLKILINNFFLYTVDGKWGQWKNSTDCSEGCGGGNLTMIRQCDNPPAMHGGDNCPSNSSYTESTNASGIQEQEALVSCNEQPCQGTTTK